MVVGSVESDIGNYVLPTSAPSTTPRTFDTKNSMLITKLLSEAAGMHC